MAKIFRTKSCRLSSMLALTGGFFLVEIIVGYVTNSMALVADSFHMLSDVAALLVGLFSVRIAKKKTSKNTFGWVRAEVVGALVNSVFLLALCFSIFVESLKRLIDIEEITDTKLMLIVGVAGLVINFLGLALFGSHGHSHGGHGHSHGGDKAHGDDEGEEEISPRHFYKSAKLAEEELTDDEDEKVEQVHNLTANGSVIINAPASSSSSNRQQQNSHYSDKKHKLKSSEQLNMRAVFLHVLGDALGSVIVIISAVTIMHVEGDWKYYIDPGMSILMVAIILSTTIPLFKEAALILLQTVPTHIQVDDVQDRLLREIDGILGVHEFHVWQLAGRRIIASAHIRCRNMNDYMIIANKVKEFFHNEGIHSTTIQPEFVDEEGLSVGAPPSDTDETKPDSECVLKCGKDAECEPNTCCGRKELSNGGGTGDSSDIRQRTCSATGATATQPDSTNTSSSVEMRELMTTAVLSQPSLSTIA